MTDNSTTPKSRHIYQVDHSVTRQDRWRRNGHDSGILWLTGLSGSGKSTLAVELERRLFQQGYNVYILDGDNLRNGLNRDLGFSPDDRTENIRRVGELAGLFAESGAIVITAFISPYQADREMARQVAPDLFHEVYVEASLAACEGRDPKGLYKKARAGEIPEFTGISAPYQAPETPNLVVNTERLCLSNAIAVLMRYVEEKFGVPEPLSQVA